MKQQTQHTNSLPDGWRWEKLGIACRVQSGGTPSSGIAKSNIMVVIFLGQLRKT